MLEIRRKNKLPPFQRFISIILTGNNESKLEKETTLGNKLKFKLEMMFTMLAAGRDEQAAEMYNQLIAEFDKLK